MSDTSISLRLDGRLRSIQIEIDPHAVEDGPLSPEGVVPGWPEEQRWAAAHPHLYASGGVRAFERSQARQQHVVATWAAVPALVAIVAVFTEVPPPDHLLSKLVVLAVGAMVVGALALVPSVLLVAVPALVHAAALDRRDEHEARCRAEPRERLTRLRHETAENDRRLSALGIDL